jgi:hypothetical protein
MTVNMAVIWPMSRTKTPSHELRDQQHREADAGVEQRGSERDPREDIEREDHLLHVIRVGQHEARSAVGALGEQPVHDHADEQDDREIRVVAFMHGPPARLEDDGKDECVDHQHDQRIEQRPCDSHDRAAVAPDDIALHHGAQQLPVPPRARDHLPRRDRECLHLVLYVCFRRWGATPGTGHSREPEPRKEYEFHRALMLSKRRRATIL